MDYRTRITSDQGIMFGKPIIYAFQGRADCKLELSPMKTLMPTLSNP